MAQAPWPLEYWHLRHSGEGSASGERSQDCAANENR